MSEKKIKAIYGTRDILPDDAPIWQHVMTTVASLASNYNYRMIQPPIFEATELFARGIGETSDIVSKEMYTFTDQGDHSLTLRPEATASVVRAYLEHSMAAREGMVKVWYLGPMFRQERPQAGRFRQFYQFGVEAIGSLDSAIDAEVITLNFRILSALGLEGLKIHINSIGMPNDRQAHRKAFAEYVAPKLDQFCQDCQKRFQTNPLRMFDCKEEGCIALLKDAPLIIDHLSDENKEHFENVMQYLEISGIPYKVDKRLVRGLDYYTRTAWEIKSDQLGSQDSLSGGGRYDLLVEQLGGPPTPAIGFAAGIERIIMAMPKSNPSEDNRKLGIFVVSMDDNYRTEAFRLIDKVRGLGVPADTDYLGKSLKAQMKQANKSDFSHVIILAENELSRGMVAIKNMNNSEQFEVELKRIYKLINSAEFGELLGRKQ